MAIASVDFSENAKPLAQAAALNEVRRFRLHVAMSDVHKALLRGDVDDAKRLAQAALSEAQDD